QLVEERRLSHVRASRECDLRPFRLRAPAYGAGHGTEELEAANDERILRRGVGAGHQCVIIPGAGTTSASDCSRAPLSRGSNANCSTSSIVRTGWKLTELRTSAGTSSRSRAF